MHQMQGTVVKNAQGFRYLGRAKGDESNYIPFQYPDRWLPVWQQQLEEMGQVITWQFMDQPPPCEEDIGITFSSRRERDAYVNAVKDFFEEKPFENTDQYARSRYASREYTDALKELGVLNEDGRYDPKNNERLQPAIILHSSFPNFFRSWSEASEVNKKEVLFHELAHCFHDFPNIRTMKRDGTMPEAYIDGNEAQELQYKYQPEASVSWAETIIGGNVNFIKITLDPSWNYIDDITGKDFVPMAKCWNALLPLDWIARWFQKAHWDEKRSPADLLARPEQYWRMRFQEVKAERASSALEHDFAGPEDGDTDSPVTIPMDVDSGKASSSREDKSAMSSTAATPAMATRDRDDNESVYVELEVI
ncbi:hypothetical protein BDV96DRAFT_654478 [Lophiotrema nucula]|uniref:Uncharacterized protein n=1 Tax=Lophiotrema nucula TaxID=690887 RepID=A0A6A5YKK4_9PLEO|nr:hypothetical protein BDV96DRAFT_654478 [Lophiotrema nucula]